MGKQVSRNSVVKEIFQFLDEKSEYSPECDECAPYWHYSHQIKQMGHFYTVHSELNGPPRVVVRHSGVLIIQEMIFHEKYWLFCVKMFLSNRQTFGDTSPELQLSCLDSGYCRWWVLNITQTSHGKNVMHNGIDKVCVKCTAQWDCLRGAGVTFFWIGWEHDLSLPSLYIKCRQTNTDHCQCVDDKLTLWREKVCPITSASVCALTEFSSHVGIQVNPNK